MPRQTRSTTPSEGSTPVTSAATVAPQQYSQGKGYAVGQEAPSDVFLDTESGKYTKEQPERGQVVAVKGQAVEPWAARALKDAKFKA